MSEIEFLMYAERDAYVINAIHKAAEAMNLLTGATLVLSGVSGTVNFDNGVLRLCRALVMLGDSSISDSCL